MGPSGVPFGSPLGGSETSHIIPFPGVGAMGIHQDVKSGDGPIGDLSGGAARLPLGGVGIP